MGALGLWLFPGRAAAQSADDSFHAGAQSYITNNMAGARQQVDLGLQLFPDDVKLKKLDELLKQKQQQNQQKNQNQDQKQNQNQDQNQQQQQNADNKEQQQSGKPEEKKDQQPPQKQDPKEGQPQDQKPEQQSGEGNDFDKAQARALLDNLREDEKNWNFFPELLVKTNQMTEPAKDW